MITREEAMKYFRHYGLEKDESVVKTEDGRYWLNEETGEVIDEVD